MILITTSPDNWLVKFGTWIRHFHRIIHTVRLSCGLAWDECFKYMILQRSIKKKTIMTSSNGNIFRVTVHLCGDFTGLWWIPRTKASDAELWCFLWSATNGWVNTGEAGDLRRYRALYDVIVMNQRHNKTACEVLALHYGDGKGGCMYYRKVSNIRRTKSQNLIASRLIL